MVFKFLGIINKHLLGIISAFILVVLAVPANASTIWIGANDVTSKLDVTGAFL